ncbi:MAG: cellulase [Streptosporangiales bacterium]|nr:cellulase [Streptosporangiales bacterium]
MWDFSWLERRWSGGGYEDWGAALDGLAERGYDAVRIDAYPHLVGIDPQREWELRPVWTQHAWGAPDRLRVRVQPALNEFIAACAQRGIAVALSSWFRDDRSAARMTIANPRRLGEMWVRTLDGIAADGLMGHVLYADLCNEYPLPLWTPFLYGTEEGEPASRTDPEVVRWMAESIATVRARHPGVPYCFSFCNEFDSYAQQDVDCLDFLEPHLWMVQEECSDFYRRLDYGLGPDRFDPAHYSRLAARGEALYRSDPEHWQARLDGHIRRAADWSRHVAKPLITTECWAIVNYKDWPGLDWGWVKELCEHGLTTALATGRWAALATSNFCGPQFAGMWRDVGWHQRLTAQIHDCATNLSADESPVVRQLTKE